eukprot:COSAG01_NODE_53164_length_341_cov_0.698347_1_plen_30_part_10
MELCAARDWLGRTPAQWVSHLCTCIGSPCL